MQKLRIWATAECMLNLSPTVKNRQGRKGRGREDKGTGDKGRKGRRDRETERGRERALPFSGFLGRTGPVMGWFRPANEPRKCRRAKQLWLCRQQQVQGKSALPFGKRGKRWKQILGFRF